MHKSWPDCMSETYNNKHPWNLFWFVYQISEYGMIKYGCQQNKVATHFNVLCIEAYTVAFFTVYTKNVCAMHMLYVCCNLLYVCCHAHVVCTLPSICCMYVALQYIRPVLCVYKYSFGFWGYKLVTQTPGSLHLWQLRTLSHSNYQTFGPPSQRSGLHKTKCSSTFETLPMTTQCTVHFYIVETTDQRTTHICWTWSLIL